jgi:formylmethanofuran dehydrogenase subunit E
MGAAEIFRADGVYLRFNEDDTIILATWAHCDKCAKQFDKAQLTTHSELWLCAICR